MTERRVGLDIAAGGRADHQSPRAGTGGERDPANQEQIDRFRSALAGPAPGTEIGVEAGARPDVSGGGHARGAFDLFGRVHRDTWDAREERTAELAVEVAERILVSGDDGHEARVYIREDVLPGVELQLYRAEGRWVIGFLVTDPASLELIAQHGARIADELAERLQSAVEVRVSDPRDPDSEGDPSHVFFADSQRRDGSGR